MKKISLIFLCSLLAILLISSQHSTSARRLPQSQDEKITEVAGEMGHATPTLNPQEEEEDMATLMGLEECKENDEACFNRRMVAEAHLDYIYTQKNKPKP
ncbi:PREDICTED: putative phytosulfokines 6 [Ipomoea nil]|uniref:putative phytosulfokines 6 n=1 Tax=Ipomoea nil TaxID=35883 RepID=UPI000900E48F|nr:PREDICTED: putative phytosulfokines 6 [Ipomoea nil]